MKFKLYGILAGGAAVIGGGAMKYQSMELTRDYQPVQATIISTEVDCYIKKGKKSIVHSETDKLMYMDCDYAPVVADNHGMSERAIKQRVVATYAYSSPVDGRRYEGEFTRKGRDKVEDYPVGKTIPVFAHNEKPDDTITVSGNPFVDDAYKM